MSLVPGGVGGESKEENVPAAEVGGTHVTRMGSATAAVKEFYAASPFTMNLLGFDSIEEAVQNAKDTLDYFLTWCGWLGDCRQPLTAAEHNDLVCSGRIKNMIPTDVLVAEAERGLGDWRALIADSSDASVGVVEMLTNLETRGMTRCVNFESPGAGKGGVRIGSVTMFDATGTGVISARSTSNAYACDRKGVLLEELAPGITAAMREGFRILANAATIKVFCVAHRYAPDGLLAAADDKPFQASWQMGHTLLVVRVPHICKYAGTEMEWIESLEAAIAGSGLELDEPLAIAACFLAPVYTVKAMYGVKEDRFMLGEYMTDQGDGTYVKVDGMPYCKTGDRMAKVLTLLAKR
jgi:hypothetical protein